MIILTYYDNFCCNNFSTSIEIHRGYLFINQSLRFRRKEERKETVFYLDSPYVPYGFNGKGGKGGWNKGHAEEDPRLLFRKIEVTRVKVALKRGKGTGISTG